MVQLLYDGSFEGFLCAVFMAFAEKLDCTIAAEDRSGLSLFQTREVITDAEIAERVKSGTIRRLGENALHTVEAAFLTHRYELEDDLLRYFRKCFAAGRDVSGNRSDESIYRVIKAAVCAEREAHRMLGFVRFFPCGKFYMAEIHPTNDLLPLIATHFVERFSTQAFVIRDHTHRRALLYDGTRYAIVDFASFTVDSLQKDDPYETLWCRYYQALCIKERRNPKLRRAFIPLKYWKDLPEMRDIPSDLCI